MGSQRRIRIAGAAVLLAFAIQLSGAGLALQTSPAGKPEAALTATGEILKSVSRLRGLEIKRPVKSAIKTQDEIERAVIADLDEDTTPEEFAATAKTLAMLGLVPPKFALREYMAKLLREQVAGFYEPKTQEFYLAAWIPISEQKTVIAHELVHALQDQHFDLRRFERWPKGDSDSELAVHSLIEGEATLVMFEYTAELQGRRLDVRKIGSLTEFMLSRGNDDDAQFPVLSKAPAVLRDTLQFPYVYGIGFVQEVLKRESWQTLNDSYVRLPGSTEQIMHPERFLTRDEPIRIEIPNLAPALGRDWKQTDRDVNGEFGYVVLLGEFLDKRRAAAAAQGWGGDRYALYEHKPTGALMMAQFTTWDTAADAGQFFDAYCRRVEKRYHIEAPIGLNLNPRIYRTGEGLASVELRDRDVVIIEGSNSTLQLTRLARLMWQSSKK